MELDTFLQKVFEELSEVISVLLISGFNKYWNTRKLPKEQESLIQKGKVSETQITLRWLDCHPPWVK